MDMRERGCLGGWLYQQLSLRIEEEKQFYIGIYWIWLWKYWNWGMYWTAQWDTLSTEVNIWVWASEKETVSGNPQPVWHRKSWSVEEGFQVRGGDDGSSHGKRQHWKVERERGSHTHKTFPVWMVWGQPDMCGTWKWGEKAPLGTKELIINCVKAVTWTEAEPLNFSFRRF